jgi:hypothetical protein
VRLRSSTYVELRMSESLSLGGLFASRSITIRARAQPGCSSRNGTGLIAALRRARLLILVRLATVLSNRI